MEKHEGKNHRPCPLRQVLLTFRLAKAQQREKVYRIGYLSSGKPSPNPDPGFNAFRQRLRELGYVEGQNVVIEYRYAELDATRLSVLATELANLKVDVILTSPDEPPIRAAQLAIRTIPVVMPGIVVDPTESTFWGEKQEGRWSLVWQSPVATSRD